MEIVRVANHRLHCSFQSLLVVPQQLPRRVLPSSPSDPLQTESAQPKGLEGRGAGLQRIRTRASILLLQSRNSSNNTKNTLCIPNRKYCITTEAHLNNIITTLLIIIIKDGCILANLHNMPMLTNNSKLPLWNSLKSRQIQGEE